MPDPIPESLVEVGCEAFYRVKKGGFLGGNVEEGVRAALVAMLAHSDARRYVIEEAVAGMDEYPDTDGEFVTLAGVGVRRAALLAALRPEVGT